MVEVTSVCIVAADEPAFSFGVRARTEIKIWYVEGSHVYAQIKGLRSMQ